MHSEHTVGWLQLAWYLTVTCDKSEANLGEPDQWKNQNLCYKYDSHQICSWHCKMNKGRHGSCWCKDQEIPYEKLPLQNPITKGHTPIKKKTLICMKVTFERNWKHTEIYQQDSTKAWTDKRRSEACINIEKRSSRGNTMARPSMNYLSANNRGCILVI